MTNNSKHKGDYLETVTTGEVLEFRPATMTRAQAAHYLGVKPSWLANNAGTRRAPAHLKLGGQVRYLRDDLDSWLRQQRVAA